MNRAGGRQANIIHTPSLAPSSSLRSRPLVVARALLHRADFWAALLLLSLPFLLFWRVWWPNEALRQTFAFGDFVEQYYPMRAFVAGEWRSARLPLWDPYTYGGTPAAAGSLFAAFYPVGFWLALFPSPFPFAALELEAIFHLGLAGVFTLLFVRRLTGSLGAAFLAGVVFSLGGFLTSYPLLQLGILETAVWLPAGLWLVEGGLAERDARRLALAGAVFGCALLAGHPQTFLYIAYLAAAYFVYRALALRLPWRSAVGYAVLVGGTTATISAVQWLPSLELAPLSPRAALSYEAVSNGFALPELWGLLRPNAGEWSPLYVGWIPLLLAIVGVLTRRAAWFWLAVAIVATLLALGRNGFLYPLVHGAVPGFSSFRNQERVAFLVSFALSVMAGYGFAALMMSRLRQGLGQRRRLILGIVLAGLTFADLARANSGLVLAAPQEGGYFPKTGITEHLRVTGASDWRTSSEGLLPGDGNAGQVYRLRDTTGNSPLHLAQYDQFVNEVPEARVWQLLNIQHLVTRRNIDHRGALRVMTDGDVNLYQIFGARPAWIVHDYRLVPTSSAAVLATAVRELDPMSTAILEEQPPIEPVLTSGEETAALVRFSPQRVAVDARLAAPGLLVSSEVAYPGWVPYVNGQRARSLRAYGLLRAVALPAGAWNVEWRYEPLFACAGLALSLLGLGLVIWLLVARQSLAAPHRAMRQDRDA